MSKSSEDFASRMRITALKMVHRAGASHIGSGLSAMDILAVLYSETLRIETHDDPNRDIFIMSKGHAAAAYYSALYEAGIISSNWIENYCQDGAQLAGHVTSNVTGVEISTGALGHGLPVGLGFAVAAMADRSSRQVYVLMSDGECDEGSVWEAALIAAQLGVTNLTAIVDYNKIQSFGRTTEVADLEPFNRKWEAFRWNTFEIDGHDHDAISVALRSDPGVTGPKVIIANTVKGKGVSFMEDKLEWHYRSPNDEELAQAVREIKGDEVQ